MACIWLLQTGIDKVETKRHERGWSRRELAQQARVSRSTVEKLCTGKNVDTKKCWDILNALGLTLENLEIEKDYERVKYDKRIKQTIKQRKPILSLDHRVQSDGNYDHDYEHSSNNLVQSEQTSHTKISGKESYGYTTDTNAVQSKDFYIDIDTILALQDQGLIIEEQELFSSTRILHDNYRIFWPIVPAIAPNLIHAVFIRYLRHLVKSGLSPVIFVFDEYYEALRRSQKGRHKKQIEAFLDALIGIGFQGISYQIILQSEINESPQQSINLIETMITYFASIQPDKLGHILKPNQHELESSSLLRFVKPVFNMLYLQLTGDQYGFIFAGYDEQPQWATYRQIAEKHGLINPVKLYIPIMHGCNGEQTNVMDRSRNISTSDSLNSLFEKCLASLESGAKNNAIFYALKYIYFAEAQQLHVIDTKHKRELLIESFDDLLMLISQNEIEMKNFASAISKALRDILNGSIYLKKDKDIIL